MRERKGDRERERDRDVMEVVMVVLVDKALLM